MGPFHLMFELAHESGMRSGFSSFRQADYGDAATPLLLKAAVELRRRDDPPTCPPQVSSRDHIDLGGSLALAGDLLQVLEPPFAPFRGF